ncbi:hypothetical protein ABW20_dc0108415 [Dactylellina cionopaga]|nr:hypothetical protein ABW20_dc0108415 [Dactylellina cionopaga]
MATHVQNLKNFIRHGKQARDPGPAPPTTASTHAHAHAVTEPAFDGQPKPHGEKAGDFTVGGGGAQANLVAQAEHQVAQKQQAKQSLEEAEDRDAAVARIVAEERESRGKLPRYPGLERWILVEKMGDGAFSNVYRAKDSLGELGEVAIKVVRKYELSSSQVSFFPCREAYPYSKDTGNNPTISSRIYASKMRYQYGEIGQRAPTTFF